MELAGRIDVGLWSAIEHSYEARDYSAAILDAIHFLSQLIRDRSGLESDGQALVGAAFGGSTPTLKVNQLQTESDWNVQKGIEQLLRGLYQAIRNPRSHQRYNDTLETAQALILFVNYVLQFVAGAKSPFEKSAFLDRVFDTQFPENERYAELLVSEIPPGQRYNMLIEAYRLRENGSISKLKFFFLQLLRLLTDEDVRRFCQVVSDELKVSADEKTIRFVRHILQNRDWPRIEEIARIRAENMLIASVRQGMYDPSRGCTNGHFGTWAGGIEEYFVLKDDLEAALSKKLGSETEYERQYVIQYFFRRLPIWVEEGEWGISLAIQGRLTSGDKAVYDALESLLKRNQAPSWKDLFAEEMKNFSAASESSELQLSDDDVPF